MHAHLVKSLAWLFLLGLTLPACDRSKPVAVNPAAPTVSSTDTVDSGNIVSSPTPSGKIDDVGDSDVIVQEQDAQREPVAVSDLVMAGDPEADSVGELALLADSVSSGESEVENSSGNEATDSSDEPSGGEMAKNEQNAMPVPAGPPPMRLFLPTTDGTLIVDVDVRIGDKSLEEAFNTRLSDLMSEARGDAESSELSWQQVFELIGSDQQRFGRQPIDAKNYKEMIRRYDRNRDRKPNAEEVAKLLFRNSGFAGPFRLGGTDHYRHSNRSDSVLFKAIDLNGNRMLDLDELNQAEAALLRIDQNSDQRISLTEAGVTQPDNDPAWNLRRSNRRGEVAMDLQGYVDWTMVSYSLDGMLDGAPLGIANPSLGSIDEDGDQSISGDEARKLLEAEPDLTLLVKFAERMSDAPSIEIVSGRPELNLPESPEKSSTSVTLVGPSLRLTAMVRDMPIRQNQIPLEIFSMLDANSDGGLDETEIPPQAADQFSFDDLDADDDGKLTFQEINNRERGDEPFWTMQVRGRAAEFPDGVFAWLDRDCDLVLSEREIQAAGDRLNRSGAESLRPSDIPDTYVIQFARGDPTQDNQHFRFDVQPSSAAESVPKWARHMDVNKDGEISAQEFVGTIPQFERIDTNQDGFIDQQEVLEVGQ